MNKQYISSIVIFLSAFCNSMAYAGDSLDGILSAISANNPDIKASMAMLKKDSIDIASTNYLEDPSVDFEYLFGSKSVGDKWAIGISQGFEWPGMYKSRKQANKSKTNALSYSAITKRLEVLYQAKLLCLDIININKKIAVWQCIHDRYAEMYDNYSLALNQREITILDINKLRIELANTSQALEDLKVERDGIIADLNALNGSDDLSQTLTDGLAGYPSEEFFPLEEYVQQYDTYDPESNYYNEMQDALKTESSIARMGWLPKFSVGYKYSNEIGDGFNGFTIGASIPLFANRKKTEAAKAQKIANTFAKQGIEKTSIARIKSTFAKAVSLKKQLEIYKSSLDFQANQDLLKKALEGHQISLLDYIQESIYFLNAQNQMMSIEYEYYTTMAELNKYSLIYQEPAVK